MPPAASDSAAAGQKAKGNGGKKEVKILMLHGYTQSGALFRAKTRALEKLLVKTLNPFSLLPVLIYPTGPNRLYPSDIPGYQPPQNGSAGAPDEEYEEDDDVPEAYAWFRKDEATGTYRYWDEGMATIAQAIREAGGIDAVCGFSQGACVSGVVAAALEPDRAVPEGKDGDWARQLRDANGGKGVKFGVSYAGFWAIAERLQWCYEPKIKTPMLNYVGSLDAVVEEKRTQALIDRCENPVVVTHPGGHHVPVAKEWAMPLAGFIKDHANDDATPKAGL